MMALIWRVSKPFIFSSRQILSLDIITHAIFSTRDIGPLKKKRCYVFDSFSLPLTETIKINMKLSEWPLHIMSFACDFLCFSR